jgi:tRNA (guanosine-2'-O-)-methyltransferase
MIERELISYLEKFVSERRSELFDKILAARTSYISVVLEDIFQPHNASAVLRTCDCLGIQEVHIIENRNEYNVNPDVTLGSDKWLTLVKYKGEGSNTLKAYKNLRERGYRIVATSLHEKGAVSLDKFDLAKGPVALVFGTEMHGLSEQAVEAADEYLKIPMYGFTESYNISVSAAIILYELTRQLRKSDILWQMSEDEKISVKLNWLRSSIKKSELLEENYFRMKKKG